MQNHLKKIFSDTVIYSAGSIFNRLLPFLLLPVYTYYFEPAKYGVFSLIYSFWFFVIIFYLFGMETSFQKFFIEAKEPENRKKIFSTAVIIVSAASMFFSAVIFLLSTVIAKWLTGSPANAYLIRLLALILVIDALSRFPMILINGVQNSKAYSIINGICVVINVASNLVFIVVLKMGIEAIFYSYAISYLCLFFLSFSYVRKYFEFKTDRQVLKTLVKFAHSFLYYGIFIVSIDLVDRFILEYFKGTSDVGIYSACYRVGIVMNLLISGFRTAWIPFFLNLKGEENNKEIFSKIFSYFCYGGLLLFLVISLFINDIAAVKIGEFTLLNKNYWSGLGIIPFILLAYLFFGLYTNLNVASYFENKIKYLIISSAAGCASNVILNLILIPAYSITGAAIATMLSYMIMFFVLYYFSQKIYKINYEWRPVIYITLITFILYFAIVIISDKVQIAYFMLVIVKIISVFIVVFFVYRQVSLKRI
jgi:O-antigen/teichoic acid export membrane protein